MTETVKADYSIFNGSSLDHAKHIIASGENGTFSGRRWTDEPEFIVDAILKKVDIKIGGKVLDYGSGVGRISKELYRRRPDLKITCVDVCANMVDYGRGYMKEAEFVLVEDFKGGEFDLVFSIFVLQHMNEEDVDNAIDIFSKSKFNDLVIINSFKRLLPKRVDNGK